MIRDRSFVLEVKIGGITIRIQRSHDAVERHKTREPVIWVSWSADYRVNTE